ncbi:UNVERIFIED_CONTAM: hypothetical protein RMT77_004091 [Armadillidium vulgare]
MGKKLDSPSLDNHNSEGYLNNAMTEDDGKRPDFRRMSSFAYGTVGGVTYSWENLNAHVDIKNFWGKKLSKKHILKMVLSGLCKSGQLLAIMGASGAGKTTLLNVLTYRSVDVKITGDILVNGKKADPDTLMGISAYVQQLDLFTRVFTVREQLTFHAQLRIGKKVTAAERKRRIQQVLRELGMMKCADTLIGEPGRIKGISGGEKKRLAFACELITNPLLLLCDEPTSGLDSFMALSVMKAMKDLAARGKTVVSTIHQPSSEVFELFDRLLILAEGRVAFLGTVEEAHKFFNRLERPCPENFNPGDHFIHSMAIKPGTEKEDRESIQKICDDFRDHEGKEIEAQIIEARIPPDENDESNMLSKITINKSPYRATYLNQFAAVFRRSGLELIREPSVTFVKIAQVTFFALMFGLIYLNQDPNKAGIQNTSAAIFVFVTNISFSLLFPVVITFAGELPLFLREHWNGLYRSDVYFLCRNLVELPIYIILPIIFNSITYYMVGFRPEAQYFFIATGIYILIANCAISYGYMISCLADDYNTAMVLSTPLTFPLMLFGGFYINSGDIPKYISWLQYLSWFMYGFESLSINQWDGYNITTENNTIVPGNVVLETLKFEEDDFGVDLGAILGLAVGFRLVAFLLLFIKTIRTKS